MLPFSATVTNGNITFSWQTMPGKWELLERQPAASVEWKPIPPSQYQTNGFIVSTILPLPKQKALYCVRRTLGFRPPKLPNLPPVPPLPTNLPPRFKAHP
ncbi:MAG TPA: hypothetical protein VG754_14135 [Verrucomicrobiae bacterium]|nr:hypothetical protein [Verrucomicrobiae bacterium]